MSITTTSSKWKTLDVRRRNARADRIRSTRDVMRNELLEWLGADESESSNLVRDRAGRLAIFRGLLRVVGIDTDQATIDRLQEHVHRDRHLAQYESGNRRRAELHRRNEFRKFVRVLRRRYLCVMIKTDAIKEMKEKGDLPQPARKQGQIAAPGEMLAELRSVFLDGGAIIVVEGEYTSRDCVKLECGHRNEGYAGPVLICEQCGDTRDRDEVSVENMMRLLARGGVQNQDRSQTGGQVRETTQE
ncbi:MAG: zinc ribbon domain-containing protein [Deltaproteobacteria bacterium]|nr:zinc ribbon domain-containing protein [Deltaproteobacteria bacterium]